MIARAPYGLVAALMFVRFADEWFTFFPAGALEQIRRDVDLTYAQAGAVMAALAGGGLIGFVFQVAADHVSRRLLASLGALAYGAAMIGFGLTDSFWALVVTAFVWGAASDAFVHGCEVSLVDVAGKDLPRALSRVNAWSAVGDVLAPLTLAAAIAAGLGWRSVFLGGGALMIGYAAWLAALRFPKPKPHAHLGAPVAGLWAVLRDPRVWVLAVLDGLFALLDEPLLGFMIAYLDRVAGYGSATATSLSMGAVGGGVVGYLFAERLVRGRSLAGVLTASGTGVALALPLMVFAPGALLILLSGFGFGVAGAVFYTALQSAILMLRPGQAGSTGAVVGVMVWPASASRPW